MTWAALLQPKGTIMSQPSEHPDSPASDAPAPQYQAPQGPAPQSQAPQGPAPQYQASQYQAPQPYPGQQQQAPAPQYQASQPYAGQPQQQQFQQPQQFQQQQFQQPQQFQGQYPQMSQQPPLPNPAYGYPQPKSKIAAGLLGIFLGGLGIHRFYLGYTVLGIVQLALTLVLGAFTFGLVGLWGVVEGIMILAGAQYFRRDAKGIPLRD
jgi:TM2 domain-containing membrane protein YozV